MATGVRTADIIASAFGARHAAKMQEAQGRQIVEERKYKRALAARDAKDKQFSRAATIFGMTGNAPASERAAASGSLAGLTLKKTPDERKAESEQAQLQRGLEIVQSPEAMKLIQGGDVVGLQTMLTQAGVADVSKLPKMILDSQALEVRERTRAMQEKALDYFKDPEYVQEAQTINQTYLKEKSNFDAAESRIKNSQKYKDAVVKWADNAGLDLDEIDSELKKNPKLAATIPKPGNFGLPSDYDDTDAQYDATYLESHREIMNSLQGFSDAFLKHKQNKAGIMNIMGSQSQSADDILNSILQGYESQ